MSPDARPRPNVVHGQTLGLDDPGPAVYRAVADWLALRPGPRLDLTPRDPGHLDPDRQGILPEPAYQVRSLRSAGFTGHETLLLEFPTFRQLAEVSELTRGQATDVAILEFVRPGYQSAWLAAHGARDLLTGEPARSRSQLTARATMVMYRLEPAAIWDHWTPYTTRWGMVRAMHRLEELDEPIDPSALWAWALVHGAPARVAERLYFIAHRHDRDRLPRRLWSDPRRVRL